MHGRAYFGCCQRHIAEAGTGGTGAGAAPGNREGGKRGKRKAARKAK
jgi:hypothetical protein